jgi:YD repeat-containing protein
MQALPLCLVASAVLLTSAAGGSDLQKTSTSDSGLRGPVRQCIERTTYPADENLPERGFTSTSLYSPGGWLLQSRTEYSSGPAYVTTYTYDAAGHLLRKSSGSDDASGAGKFDTTYNYDDKGQLHSASSGTGSPDLTYDRDENGRKRRVEHFPVFPNAPNTGIAAMPWENSDVLFPPPSGGTVTTVYDERDRPVEGQISDASGRLMMRIVRTYDPQGKIQGDKLIPEDMQGAVQNELFGQMNDAQKKAIAKFMGNAFASGESAYKYDSEGRVVEKRLTRGAMGDELTKTAYNDHGDVSDEVTVSTPAPDLDAEFGIDEHGNMVPVTHPEAQDPSQNEVRYSYEYDAQGNWTKKTMSTRQDKGRFRDSTVIMRTLSYY